MSLTSFAAWRTFERERKQNAKVLVDLFDDKNNRSKFRRLYLFSTAVLSRAGRLNRENELYLESVKEMVKHEHKGAATGKRVLFSIPFILAALFTLFFFPPDAIKSEVELVKETAGTAYEHYLRLKPIFAHGFSIHVLMPAKVWIGSGNDQLLATNEPQIKRRSGDKFLSKEETLSQITAQTSLIRETVEISRKNAGALGPGSVVLVRGIAKTDTGRELHEHDVVPEGTTVTTGPHSFIKFWFSEESQINLGPDTTVRLEFSKRGDPSTVALLGGLLRATVSKQTNPSGKPANKEKLIIKTKNAACGIRGTDFQVVYDVAHKVTNLLTFEGLVAIAKLMKPNDDSSKALHSSQGLQMVSAGTYSAVSENDPVASTPTPTPPAQLQALKAESELQGEEEKTKALEIIAQLRKESALKNHVPKERYQLLPKAPANLVPNVREFPDK